ncbi:MAG TPA: hypothetical protein VK975_01575 [Acidimicrobiales bacterium]|nr:hypothetical protein [Acidimicrobiales bacterium]
MTDPSGRRVLAGAIGCATLVLIAVALEVLGGTAANSPVPAWAEDVLPISWPQAARVLWWLAVAAAALSYRLSIHRLGIRQRPLVVALSVGPFLTFAAGIALGADWWEHWLNDKARALGYSSLS